MAILRIPFFPNSTTRGHFRPPLRKNTEIGIKLKLKHIQECLKGLYLCFHGQRINLLGCFIHISNLKHCMLTQDYNHKDLDIHKTGNSA